MKRNSAVLPIVIIILILILCCVVMCILFVAARSALLINWREIISMDPAETSVVISQKTAIAPIKTPLQPTDPVAQTPTPPCATGGIMFIFGLKTMWITTRMT
jgi:flagellar basal body-associated protein FliL